MQFMMPKLEDKAQFVQEQFDRIAARYDLCNNLISCGMHKYWKSKAIEKLNLVSGASYLDVCCGTGDLSMMIAHNSQVCVTGIDFSSNMLDCANQRYIKSVKEHNLNSSVAFMNGDALNLPFQDETFDGAIISFGLRNVCDYSKAIGEMTRVVKKGSRIVNLDLGHPKPSLFTSIYNFYFNNIVPLIGEIVQKDRNAYTYLPKSLETYPDEKALMQIFLDNNLQNVSYLNLAFGTVALHWGDKF